MLTAGSHVLFWCLTIYELLQRRVQSKPNLCNHTEISPPISNSERGFCSLRTKKRWKAFLPGLAVIIKTQRKSSHIMFIFRTKTSIHSVISSSAVETQVEVQGVGLIVITCYSTKGRASGLSFIFHVCSCSCAGNLIYQVPLVFDCEIRRHTPSSWFYTGGITGKEAPEFHPHNPNSCSQHGNRTTFPIKWLLFLITNVLCFSIKTL